MLSRLLQAIFSVRYPYADPIARQRARLLLLVSGAVLVIWAVWVVLFALPQVAPLPGVDTPDTLALLLLLLVVFMVYGLVQFGRVRIATWLFILGGGAAVLRPISEQFDPMQPFTMISVLLFVPLIAASVLMSRRDLLIVFMLTLGLLGLRASIQSEVSTPILYIPSETTLIDAFLFAAVAALIAVFAFLFSSSVVGLVDALSRRGMLMRQVAAFAAETGEQTDEIAIFERALTVLQVSYPVCQIFVTNEQGAASRRVRLGLSQRETGTALALRPDDAAVLGDAARLRVPLVIYEGDERSAFLVPPARAALLLPILDGQRFVGVLEIQSRQSGFAQDEIDDLMLFARQVGRVVVTARRLYDLKRAVDEQESLANRLKQQLATNRPAAASGAITLDWDTYLSDRGERVLGFDFHRNGSTSLVAATDVPESLRVALEQGEVYIETNETAQVINLPIILRDEILGVMTFSVPKDQPISTRQLEMAKTVTERLALALENNRLFEQSQLQARRERKVGEVANTLLGATDIQSVLAVAAQSFNEALGAVSTRVYLQPRELMSSEEG
jgi:GAF domain-containing protein